MQGQALLACVACFQVLSHQGVPQNYSFLYAVVLCQPISETWCSLVSVPKALSTIIMSCFIIDDGKLDSW